MRYLLVIDTVGNVVISDADSGIRMPIGAPLIPAQRSRVTTAVWSPAGEWTAWSVDSEQDDGIRELRLHDEDTDSAGVLAESVPAFYLCPSPCGRWLSHLSPGPLGLELGISEIAGDGLRIVERGQPLFWSWSPDSRNIAVHVEDRVFITDLDAGQPQLLSDRAGPFIAPWWLPGGSVLFAVEDRIVCGGGDEPVTELVDGGSAGRFAPDPEGRRLAYLDTSHGGVRLVVLDLLTGESQEVTSEPVGAFFWSPDGTRLAALVAAEPPMIQWLVLGGSEPVLLPAFRPTRRWAGTVLPFFEQYAQSHCHWSPDGSQLVAPAIDEAGASGAFIQGVAEPDRFQWIPDAELVWWV